MNELRKRVWVANQVLEALEAYRRDEDPLKGAGRSAVSKFEEVVKLCRRLEKCRGRFPHARERLVNCIRGHAADCRYYLESFSRALSSRRRAPCMREIVAELRALEQEFGALSFDRESSTLTVGTEPIELEGICLGAFEIRLHLGEFRDLDSRRPYSVVALEPNPAACNESVTHPHVRDEQLCEGDGTGAVRAALLAGRLCDFFLLVTSVLGTYNPDSPFVKLEEWEGRPCYDCGCMTGEDDRWICHCCEREFCERCIASCRECDIGACLSCLSCCPSCEEYVCGGCQEKCGECGRWFCTSCLSDGLCTECKETSDDKEEEAVEDKEVAGQLPPGQ
jgi:hypothetical protein